MSFSFHKIRLARCLPLMAAALLSLTACSEVELASHMFKKSGWGGTQETAGTYKVGNPYTVSGVRYHPREEFRLVETGIASWYGPSFHGKRTANGEIYNQHDLTAAHRTLQMPSLVRVTNLENGKSVVVRINDRGPFKRGRVIDVSRKAAELLGFIGNGTARVKLEVLEKESRQIAEAAKRGMDTSRMNSTQLAAMQATPVSTRTSSSSTVPAGNIATLRNDAEFLPESLQTPSITVEELNAPVARTVPPVQQPAAVQTAPVVVPPTPAVSLAPLASGHLKDGRFMPDPVVTQQPVTPTGIFVQAGSFSVEENAVRLADKLRSFGQVNVVPVAVNGRQFWRVRVGPIATVDDADRILDAAVRAGGSGAKVMKN